MGEHITPEVAWPAGCNCGVSTMELDSSSLQREMLLKHIENEINAGFVFVAAARSAYRTQQAEAGDGALAKAARAHQEALEIAHESEFTKLRSITHQLAELREAIEWLGEWQEHARGASKK